MELHDPANRLGKPVPFAAHASDFTLDGAKHESRNCQLCSGDGWAPVYNPRFRGDPVETEIDARTGQRQVLMRLNAYCVCPMGRKIAVLHQQSSKDVFLRTPDYHDVVAGRYPNWQTENPALRDAEPIDQARLPEAFQRLLENTRPRIYHEPEEPTDHDRINRMFNDSEAI